jgi:fatty-acid desaturase
MTKQEVKRLHTAVFMLAFHIGAVAALWYFSWTGLIFGLILWFIANCPGVGIGFHRLLTHGGFKASKGLEYTLTVLGSLALQGDHRRWVAIHRVHHQFVDEPDTDPHTPLQKLSKFMGFAWAQWLWKLRREFYLLVFSRRIAAQLRSCRL